MLFRTFIFKLIRTNMRKYSLFLLSAIFSMTVFFVYINLWYTDGFKENTNSQMQTLMIIAATITILFSIFIISYVHWYLMRERAKDFSVLLSYGMTHKNLRAIIISETSMIYVISLSVALITGSVFSKMFFMISTKLLSIDNLSFQLTYNSYIVTTIVFAVIFITILISSLIRIAHKDITELGKVKRNIELNKMGNAWFGFLGLFMVVGSTLVLFIHNQHSVENVSRWILGLGLICIIGTYLLISHFSRLIYGKFKKDTKLYYKHILKASEFVMEYRQNRKTMFVLTLLTFGILLFTSVTYTLYNESYRITDIENPHDLYLQQLEAMKLFDEEDVSEIIAQSEISIVEKSILPYLYIKAPDMQINNWRDWEWVPVVKESAFNQCFHTNYDIASNEALQIIFESDIDKDFSFFQDEIRLVNDVTSYTLKNSGTIYDKILNRYVFTHAILLIVDDMDYSKFTEEASKSEKGYLSMYQFDNWKNSKEVYDKVVELIHKGYQEYQNQNTFTNELIERYGYAFLQVRSKLSYWEIQKMQGSFSLFIMGFISILFLFCILITYCFKVFMSMEDDIKRLKKLEGIGLLSKEKENLIKARIRLLMFVPSVLGIILEAGWSYAINFKKILEIDLSNTILLRNTLCVGAVLLGIMIMYYFILKHSYMERLRVLDI